MWVHEDSMPMLGTRLALRMSIVKLSDDSLWMCTPTPHNPQLENRVAGMGEVKYIVKRPDLKVTTLLRDLDAPPWQGDLEMLAMDGAPFFDEHMFYHGRSKTLLVTDFFQNYTGVKHKGLGKIVAKLILEPIGFKGKCLAPPLKTKFAVKDRQALRASLDRIWDLDIERVVPAHGDILEQDAKQVIRGLCQRFYV
jgi:hypothetical protein